MSEYNVPVTLVGRRYACDECGEEMERPNHLVLSSDPPLHEHVCSNGHHAVLPRSYPGYDVVIGVLDRAAVADDWPGAPK